MLLLKPYLGCNINCSYCYEKTLRWHKKPKQEYNLDAIIKRIEKFYASGSSGEDSDMTLHGGEILTLPKKDIETLLAKIFKLQGKSGIQTNGTLIDDDHIAMFKKYNTSVGISWDGPDELSEYRPGTKKVGAMIDRLVKEGVHVSTIIVVSKANAGTKARLEKLKKYLLHLKSIGIHGRLNPCLGVPEFEPSMDKFIEIYLDLAKFFLKNDMNWSPFKDVIHALKGEGRVCFLSGCDPFSTESASVVVADGSMTNCMRSNKTGVLLRDSATLKTRDEILSKTPQEFGGCKDCPYWFGCHGGCPSGAIGDDWRNRTYQCPLWKALFGHYEKIFRYIGVAPVLLSSTRNNTQGGVTLDDFKNGHGDSHGDHSDDVPPQGAVGGNRPHGDCPHGDAPHGDSGHGDHSDSTLLPAGGGGYRPHGDSPHGDHANTQEKR